ncbi:MFS general substrate transporter [Fragilariopsis cylindrus CCMP1102]|uniref:MFS general substrate transporter n=1 Tax=Fragilariopsis cylindrus CCMP1102 TaxID=635003 RepID=A0A1E7FI43_9STRA|nr:MFS general substrate transporter [Fragilariopsis cylindrus CCMP1102]|eukprot:OEU17841.1 MFS general substrate transporter [Fragilariopsis cylindrus CCMP1102]
MNSSPSREEEQQQQQFYDDEERHTIIGATPTSSSPAFVDDDDTDNHNNNINHNIHSNKKNKNSSNNSWSSSWTALKLKLLDGFTSLQNSPSELYKVYFLKFLDSYSYFSFSIILTLFLSDHFDYTDIEAGTIYGVWGMMITVYGFLTGFIVDNLGVSKSLKIGYGLSLIARIGILFCISKWWLLFHLYFTLPLGNCMGIPVLMTGIRRYTTTQNRALNNNSHSHLTNGDGDGIILQEAISSPSSKKFITAPGTGTTITTNGNGNGDNNGGRGESNNVTIFQPKTGSPYKILSDVFHSSSFRRYLVVILIMINVRQIFRHLDATWPKYMIREFGPNVAKGTIYAINPILIIILVPIISATTAHIDPLVMIHYGSYISAISVFFLVLSTSIWSSICFIIVLSIGEATWSPRLNDYTVSVSEEGREGTYMALSSAPLFLAKLPVGILSGVLLQKYCPETLEAGEAGEVVQRHSRIMWFIIGSLTATSPILLTCCWKYVSKKDNDNKRHTTDVFQRNGTYTELPPTTTATTMVII